MGEESENEKKMPKHPVEQRYSVRTSFRLFPRAGRHQLVRRGVGGEFNFGCKPKRYGGQRRKAL